MPAGGPGARRAPSPGVGRAASGLGRGPAPSTRARRAPVEVGARTPAPREGLEGSRAAGQRRPPRSGAAVSAAEAGVGRAAREPPVVRGPGAAGTRGGSRPCARWGGRGRGPLVAGV